MLAMKDSAVGPAGLFDLRRQKRLLEGLDVRLRHGDRRRQELLLEHGEQTAREAVVRETTLAECKHRCSRRRRATLDAWDAAEEELMVRYETDTIRLREELGQRLEAERRAAADDAKAIHAEADARRLGVRQRYDSQKHQPEQGRRVAFARISEALRPLLQTVEQSREITLSRLDHLPQVPMLENPWGTFSLDNPTTQEEVVDAIARLGQDAERTVEEMRSGTASRIIDGPSLPAGVTLFAVVWAGLAFAFGPTPPWLAMAAGLPIAGLLAFIAYLILMRPLKKVTRQLYPTTEQLAELAERCAAIGRKLASDHAERAKVESKRRRNQQLAQVQQWQESQIRERVERLTAEREATQLQRRADVERVGQTFSSEISRVTTEMRLQAEETAESITRELAGTELALAETNEANESRRQAELKRLELRLEQGLHQAITRADATAEAIATRHPDWPLIIDGSAQQHPTVDFLPVGRMPVDIGGVSDPQELPNRVLSDAPNIAPSDAPKRASTSGGPQAFRINLPVALHRRVHSGLVISTPPDRLSLAIDLTHQVLWRLLSAAPPARAKLTLIDPIGRGQNFTSFMALADFDPVLVGHRVWTTEGQIESRLGELAHHVEDVLQAMLRDRYERIEDYNELAGSMAEPYRAIAAVGFPEGLSRSGYRHLLALIESGLRCGLFTILVCDRSKSWPDEMPLPKSEKLLPVRIEEDGTLHCDEAGFEDYCLQPALGPATDLRPALVQRIGSQALSAARVEIPLKTILPPPPAGENSAAEGLSIPIGTQGASRALSIELGEGVRQHVLIAGKTGSGKSTLLHAIIVSGAFLYRPDELQLYLLDFKKGVEFKPYADASLPHARVIGIESEREFGHSVLRRLDEELQRRGEAFRGAAAQNLATYRAASGSAMPRILLVIDEFQELFVRDDRLAADCAMLLDRLVRQGRSFGMHVILSSQSLAGAYSLPRATLGQMAVRIALQCSESDAALILADDNTAARLIGRPGEAIYNDAGGLVEGNRPFQVAWLSGQSHRELLQSIVARDAPFAASLSPPVVFEGNRPCRWSPAMANAALGPPAGTPPRRGLLGEAVEIGPPVTLELAADTGRNVLLLAPLEARGAVLSSILSLLLRTAAGGRVVYFDGRRPDDGPSTSLWLQEVGVVVEPVKPRESEAEMLRLDALVKKRMAVAAEESPLFVVIDPLDRFRDLRQDDTFQFSLDAADSAGGGRALQNVLREGPAVNVFTIVVCGAAETLTRWLPRNSLHDLELRVLGRLNATDSAALIDTPAASELSTATLLLYDDADGRIQKFRPCEQPDASQVRDWLLSPGSSTYC